MDESLARLRRDDFAYIDPPYLTSRTRTYSEYDIDHERLARILKKAKFRWILSHYLHPVYLSALGDPFWSKEMDLFVAGGHDVRTECLWSNFARADSSRTERPSLAVSTQNKVPSGACPGTYTITATTLVNGTPINTSAATLTVTAH